MKRNFFCSERVSNKVFAIRYYGIRGYERDECIAEKLHEELKAIHNEAEKFSEKEYEFYSMSKSEMIENAEIIACTEIYLEVDPIKAKEAILANSKVFNSNCGRVLSEAYTRYKMITDISDEERLKRAIFSLEIKDNIEYLNSDCNAIDKVFYNKLKTVLTYDIYSHLSSQIKVNMSETDAYNLYLREYTQGIKHFVYLMHVEELVSRLEYEKKRSFEQMQNIFGSEGYSDEEIDDATQTAAAILKDKEMEKWDNIAERDNYIIQDDLYNEIEYVLE